MLTRVVTICLLFLAPVAQAETTFYSGVQYDTDRSAAQCWLSNRSGDLRATGNVGVRHQVFQSGRWSFQLKAEHISCFGARDENDTNSVGAQIEYTID